MLGMLALGLAAVAVPPIPAPKQILISSGSLKLGPAITISAPSNLSTTASVLAEEVKVSGGHSVALTKVRGTIDLRLDPKLKPEEYRLEVSDRITISGGDVQGVSSGTASLLQLLNTYPQAIPRMRVLDRPDRTYRGLMVDVARRYHSIPTLEQVVTLCRLYKVRYLHLHLTDDQAYTLPSRAYPRLNAVNQHGGPSYTEDELKGLVKFADSRGVTIIPEIDVPGHSAAMIRAYPELFKIAGTKPYEHHATLNFADPAVLQALDTLVGEASAIFRSSPYIHIGGDEADYSLADQSSSFQAAFRELGITGKAQGELYRRFLIQMNAIVREYGKRTIVWEGFGNEPTSRFQIPKDVTVMEFESAYHLPGDLLKSGYPVINAAWTPLYVLDRHVWPVQQLLEWNFGRFGRFSNLYSTTTWFDVPITPQLQGAQMCIWEQPETVTLARLRRSLPAFSERIWNVRGTPVLDRFERQLDVTDSLLARLLYGFRVEVESLQPSSSSEFDLPNFTDSIRVTTQTNGRGELRYTTDGMPVTAHSPLVSGPLRFGESTTLRLAAFRGGKRVGYEYGNQFTRIAPSIRSLATGKPVTVSGGTQGEQRPELAVDGNLDLASSWWAGPAPQWLQVDLGKVERIGQIDVYPYWDGRRFYRYTVAVSNDGATWKTVVDQAENRIPARAQGDSFRLEPTEARFVRVNLLSGSANEAVHLVELHVWPSP